MTVVLDTNVVVALYDAGDPDHALVGFGFSAYLTYRELFTIDAICPWCVASAIVMTLLAVVTTARLVLSPNDERGAIPYVG